MTKTPQLPRDLELFLAAHHATTTNDPGTLRDLLRVTATTLPQAEGVKVVRMLAKVGPAGRRLLLKIKDGDA